MPFSFRTHFYYNLGGKNCVSVGCFHIFIPVLFLFPQLLSAKNYAFEYTSQFGCQESENRSAYPPRNSTIQKRDCPSRIVIPHGDRVQPDCMGKAKNEGNLSRRKPNSDLRCCFSHDVHFMWSVIFRNDFDCHMTVLLRFFLSFFFA